MKKKQQAAALFKLCGNSQYALIALTSLDFRPVLWVVHFIKDPERAAGIKKALPADRNL
jgi:hypothetical protein